MLIALLITATLSLTKWLMPKPERNSKFHEISGFNTKFCLIQEAATYFEIAALIKAMALGEK